MSCNKVKVIESKSFFVNHFFRQNQFGQPQYDQNLAKTLHVPSGGSAAASRQTTKSKAHFSTTKENVTSKMTKNKEPLQGDFPTKGRPRPSLEDATITHKKTRDKGPVRGDVSAKERPMSSLTVPPGSKFDIDPKSSSIEFLEQQKKSEMKEGILADMVRIRTSSRPFIGGKSSGTNLVPQFVEEGEKLRDKYKEAIHGTPVSEAPGISARSSSSHPPPVRYYDSKMPKGEVKYIPPDGLVVKESTSGPSAWEEGKKSSKQMAKQQHDRAITEEEKQLKAAERGKRAMKKALLEKQLTEVRNELLQEVENYDILGTGTQKAILGLEDASVSDEFSEVGSDDEDFSFPNFEESRLPPPTLVEVVVGEGKGTTEKVSHRSRSDGGGSSDDSVMSYSHTFDSKEDTSTATNKKSREKDPSKKGVFKKGKSKSDFKAPSRQDDIGTVSSSIQSALELRKKSEVKEGSHKAPISSTSRPLTGGRSTDTNLISQFAKEDEETRDKSKLRKSESNQIPGEGLAVKESSLVPRNRKAGKKSSKELIKKQQHERPLTEEEKQLKATDKGKQTMKKARLEKQLSEVRNELLQEIVKSNTLRTGTKKTTPRLEDEKDGIRSSDEFSAVGSEDDDFSFPKSKEQSSASSRPSTLANVIVTQSKTTRKSKSKVTDSSKSDGDSTNRGDEDFSVSNSAETSSDAKVIAKQAKGTSKKKVPDGRKPEGGGHTRKHEKSSLSHSGESSSGPSTLVNVIVKQGRATSQKKLSDSSRSDADASSGSGTSEGSAAHSTDYYTLPDGPFTSTPDGKLQEARRHSSTTSTTSTTSSTIDTLKLKRHRTLRYYFNKFLDHRPESIEQLPVTVSSDSLIRVDSDLTSSRSASMDTGTSGGGHHTETDNELEVSPVKRQVSQLEKTLASEKLHLSYFSNDSSSTNSPQTSSGNETIGETVWKLKKIVEETEDVPGKEME